MSTDSASQMALFTVDIRETRAGWNKQIMVLTVYINVTIRLYQLLAGAYEGLDMVGFLELYLAGFEYLRRSIDLVPGMPGLRGRN